jgi:trigger factor
MIAVANLSLKYGKRVLLEEVNGVASKALFDYIDEQKLHILGQPVMTEDTKIDELSKTSSYTFSFDIGLAPEFDLNISSADKYPHLSVQVTETMVNDEIERLKKQMGTLIDIDQMEENDLVYVELSIEFKFQNRTVT